MNQDNLDEQQEAQRNLTDAMGYSQGAFASAMAVPPDLGFVPDAPDYGASANEQNLQQGIDEMRRIKLQQEEDDKPLRELFKQYLAQNKLDENGPEAQVFNAVMAYDYDGPDRGNFMARVGHYINKNTTDPNVKPIAFGINDGLLRVAQGNSIDTPAAAPVTPAKVVTGNAYMDKDTRAATKATEVLPQAASAIGGAAASGFGSLTSALGKALSSPIHAFNNRNFEKHVQSATEAAKQEVLQSQEKTNVGLDTMDTLRKQIVQTPAGEQRGQLLDQFIEASKAVSENSHNSAKKMALNGADPDSKSKFKQDEHQIRENTESVADRQESIISKLMEGLKDDPDSAAKVKEEADRVREMLRRITEAIKNLFNGFKAGNKADGPGMNP